MFECTVHLFELGWSGQCYKICYSKSVAACNVLQLLFTPNTIVNKIYTHNWEIKLIMLCHKNTPHCKTFHENSCNRYNHMFTHLKICQYELNYVPDIASKCLIFSVGPVIGNECLEDSKFNANVQNALSVYIGIGGMWKSSCFGTEKQTVSWSFLFHIRTYQSWFFAHVRLFFMLHI